jgi:putative pyruvate formate lyase activating enzyme
MLFDFIDIFLPDLKTIDPVLAQKLFMAENYPKYAVNAVKNMAEKRPVDFTYFDNLINGKEKLLSGTIVRHLVLPGEIESTALFLKWFAENLNGKAILSIMFQYEPSAVAWETCLPKRRISRQEIERIYELFEEFKIEDGFVQETENDNSWLPDFYKPNPFSGSMENPLWHWQRGFADNK